jgi:hypothetical protein
VYLAENLLTYAQMKVAPLFVMEGIVPEDPLGMGEEEQYWW